MIITNNFNLRRKHVDAWVVAKSHVDKRCIIVKLYKDILYGK